MIQSGICDGDQLGTSPDVGRGVGVSRAFHPGRPSPNGRKPTNHRLVLDGIFWIACREPPWRDLLEEFGKWSPVYRQFRRWTCWGLGGRTWGTERTLDCAGCNSLDRRHHDPRPSSGGGRTTLSPPANPERFNCLPALPDVLHLASDCSPGFVGESWGASLGVHALIQRPERTATNAQLVKSEKIEELQMARQLQTPRSIRASSAFR